MRPWPTRATSLPSARTGSAPGDDDGFPAVDDLENQTLGQYRLGTVIGRGSMGRVYRAEHLGLHRPCAIKVMNPGLVVTQPQVREDFWAEARVVANLVHPHVVTIHNLGDDRGYHYIEMEYVPGGLTLRESLARGRSKQSGPRSWCGRSSWRSGRRTSRAWSTAT